MKRIYYVLSRNGDDAWHEQQVEAYSPEQAIEEVASTEGEYVAVLDRYFVQRRVGQVTKLAVLRDAD
jgi:hypothetical protein